MPELMSIIFLFLCIPSLNIKYLRSNDSLPSSSCKDLVNCCHRRLCPTTSQQECLSPEIQALNGECHRILTFSLSPMNLGIIFSGFIILLSLSTKVSNY
ncbi:unnamed protein product [Moneuplotes crassus]|uniref:Uncharacterized protein n=1 Tax=Euplotes crassus TaxID=5936 RepID=A0AAD1X8R1_EUPCR|nr:unnamed protein product [Moneuplotes crassus]